MVSLQILSKVVNSGDYSIIEDNLLDSEYFVGYEDEFNFITEHYNKYGNVPDKITFLSKFNDFEILDVSESDNYLIDTIREEHLYAKAVPILQKSAEILKTNSNDAVQFMLNAIKSLKPTYSVSGVDIIHTADDRFNKFVERKENQDKWFFTTGFEELDDIIHGIQREEELCVIFARTGQGKSWVLEKMCTHVWQLGFNVGYISPEMSGLTVGYRFDTLFNHFSNSGLMWGNNEIEEDTYKEYIDKLREHKNKFIVSTPIDFNRKITVSKLRELVLQEKLDLLAVDGIKYMTDERYKRGDNTTTSLTNISEDLMLLSMELHIPIIVVVQSNRDGINRDDASSLPELEHIRDSDGIAQNASKVISLKQSENNVLTIGIKKQRFGAVGGKLTYHWNINTGDFDFIPSFDDAQPHNVTAQKVQELRSRYTDKSDVF